MFGSFPPVALALTEGREVIEAETRRVCDAWQACDWLEVGRFPRDRAFENEDLHYPWWSLRNVAVDRLSDAIESAHIPQGGSKQISTDQSKMIARFLLCEIIVRFGFKLLNRAGSSPYKAIDMRLIERVFHYSQKSIPIPVFYKRYFDGFNFAKFIDKLTGLSLSCDTFPAFESHIKTKENWLSVPASGSLLGMIPTFQTGKLHTSDSRDTQSYRDLRERLLGFEESKEEKPLNLLVLGSPGSGKSFAVTEILEGVYKGKKPIAFLEYNLASFGSDGSALTSAFLEIQDVALKGKIPIVFWDEYDTTAAGQDLGWLSKFLGPMQDGKFLVGQTSRAIPKSVFVFAGSIFSRFDQLRFLDALIDSPASFKLASDYELKRKISSNAKSPEVENEYDIIDKAKTAGRLRSFFNQIIDMPIHSDVWKSAKGRDFKSRITGVLDISSVDPLSFQEQLFGLQEDVDGWLFRRACSLRNAFERQAGHLLNKDDELQISNETLFSFLTLDKFSHGQRSIESLVRMSSLYGRAVADGSVNPTAAQVRLHAEDDFFRAKSMTYDKVMWFKPTQFVAKPMSVAKSGAKKGAKKSS